MNRFILINLLFIPGVMLCMQAPNQMSNEAIKSAFKQVKEQSGDSRQSFAGILADLHDQAVINGKQKLARSIAVFSNHRRAAATPFAVQGSSLQSKFNQLPKLP